MLLLSISHLMMSIPKSESGNDFIYSRQSGIDTSSVCTCTDYTRKIYAHSGVICPSQALQTSFFLYIILHSDHASEIYTYISVCKMYSVAWITICNAMS